ncbi:MAG: type II toxin-antitoxin system HicA family toxin [Desulfobacterales bacterium]
MFCHALGRRASQRQNGCQFERQGKGYHEIWYSPVDSKIKSRHTANSILKQAGLEK